MEISNLFKKEMELRRKGKCPFCEETVKFKEFLDPLSFKEFKISGLCSNCQKDYFKK